MRIKIATDLLNWVPGRVKGFSEKNLLEMVNGGIKMIKVGPSASYPAHQHTDKTEFIYVLKGSLNIIIGNNNFQGKEGEFYLLPRSVRHSITNATKDESIILLGNITE